MELKIVYICLFIILLIIIVGIYKPFTSETFVSDARGYPLYVLDENYYPTNRPDLDERTRDSHEFLRRSIISGKKDIGKKNNRIENIL